MRWAVRVLGWTTAGGLVAVSLLPSERFGVLHGVAVVASRMSGLAATLLATDALLRDEPRPPLAGMLGTALLVFAAVDFALYVPTLPAMSRGPVVIPVLEKIALLLLLAWMLPVAIRACQPARSDPAGYARCSRTAH